jgi:hypothetical protein
MREPLEPFFHPTREEELCKEKGAGSRTNPLTYSIGAMQLVVPASVFTFVTTVACFISFGQREFHVMKCMLVMDLGRASHKTCQAGPWLVIATSRTSTTNIRFLTSSVLGDEWLCDPEYSITCKTGFS